MPYEQVARHPVTGSRLQRLLTAVRDRIALWSGRELERRWLAECSDHTLRDIGLSRSELRREVDKPFWRP